MRRHHRHLVRFRYLRRRRFEDRLYRQPARHQHPLLHLAGRRPADGALERNALDLKQFPHAEPVEA